MYNILGLKYNKQEPILILSNKELEFGKKFAEKNNIKSNDLVIGINTGAGGRWQDKKLGIEETAELIDKLSNELGNKNIKILLFGGPEEKERNEKIKKLAKTEIIDAGCDNSLMEFASLVNLCSILVTSDSLALHIGTALKKKIVGYLGWLLCQPIKELHINFCFGLFHLMSITFFLDFLPLIIDMFF